MKQLFIINTKIWLCLLLLFVHQAEAAHKVTGVKTGQSSITVYSEPKSSKKSGKIAVDDIPELKSGGPGLEVLDDANNGRFLKVKINDQPGWIKSKQVKTDIAYDVGKCDTSNKTSGIRGGINCTK